MAVGDGATDKDSVGGGIVEEIMSDIMLELVRLPLLAVYLPTLKKYSPAGLVESNLNLSCPVQLPESIL